MFWCPAVAPAVQGKTHSLPRGEPLCLINLTPTTRSLSPYLPFHSRSRPFPSSRDPLFSLTSLAPSLTPFVLLAFLLPAISFLSPTCPPPLCSLFPLIDTLFLLLDFPSHSYLFFTVTFSFSPVACSSPELHGGRA